MTWPSAVYTGQPSLPVLDEGLAQAVARLLAALSNIPPPVVLRVDERCSRLYILQRFGPRGETVIIGPTTAYGEVMAQNLVEAYLPVEGRVCR